MNYKLFIRSFINYVTNLVGFGVTREKPLMCYLSHCVNNNKNL